MADHYKVLGLTRNATKDEIKNAFRKLAVKFHPDKHAQSSKLARDAATVEFKQVSEAYEVLIDDRKRAAYNSSYRNNGAGGGYQSSSGYYYYYYYQQPRYRSSRASSGWNSGVRVSNLENAVRYMTTRAFLLNVFYASILLGGAMAVNSSVDAAWKMKNSGKSFEEAMETVEKNKAQKNKQ